MEFKNKNAKFMQFTKVVDAIIFCVVLASIIINLVYKENVKSLAWVESCINALGNNYSPIILVSLLPLTVTIISIVISFSKNEVYGIPLNKFQKLCGFRFYSLKHIFLVAITLFAVYFILFLFDLQFSILILEAVTILLSGIFGVQQLELFTNNKEAIEKLIVGKYKIVNFKNINEIDDDSECNLYKKLIRNFTIVHGIEDLSKRIISVFKISNEKEKEMIITNVFSNLLKLKFDFYKDFEETMHDENDDKTENEIIKLIASSYDDVIYILKEDHAEPILNSDVGYVLEKTMHIVHEICRYYSLLNYNFNRYKEIFKFVDCNDNNIQFFFRLRFPNEEDYKDLWFIDYYKAYYNKDLFINNKIKDFSIFITIAQIFLTDNENLRLEQFQISRKSLEDDIEDPTKDTFHNYICESWRNLFCDFILNANKDEMEYILKRSFKIFDLVEDDIDNIYIYMHSSEESKDNQELFSKKTILNYWLLYFCVNQNINENDAISIINNLPSIEKRMAISCFNDCKFIKNVLASYNAETFNLFIGKKISNNKLKKLIELVKIDLEDSESSKKNIVKKTPLQDIIKSKIISNLSSDFGEYKILPFYNSSLINFDKSKIIYDVKEIKLIDENFDNYYYLKFNDIFESIIQKEMNNFLAKNISNEKTIGDKGLKEDRLIKVGDKTIYFIDDGIKFNVDIEGIEVSLSQPDKNTIYNYMTNLQFSENDDYYVYPDGNGGFDNYLKDEMFKKMQKELISIMVKINFAFVIDINKCFIVKESSLDEI